ncbi:MAG: carboxylesterase family protein [Acidobacteriota bacterium]|jgi:para-nitrobenzyl esterase|nr:carboxylesterase family protein [Acidobacteriota bacterium]
MKRMLLLPLLFSLAAVACGGRPDGRDDVGKESKDPGIDASHVLTAAGAVSGTTTRDGAVKVFMGVPFAAPPLGELRWRAPRPAEPWTGVRACVAPPPSAMQAAPAPFHCWSEEFLVPAEPISEDCLYLNIWTPARRADEKLPVFVWIHGGAFTSGSGTVPLYDGEMMARQGVVFVTVNYRLGIFGFLAHPELSSESPDKVSGNYGILDQIAALRWLGDNIAAFGGDPGCVTVAGQSAGAFSVNALAVSPLARGLFHRLVAQSGGGFGKDAGFGGSLGAAELEGSRLTEERGLSVGDLRKMPADALLELPARSGLTIDNVVIPPIRETFAAGRQNDVPTLTGWNADDGITFAYNADRAAYKKSVQARYGMDAARYLAAFPGGTDAEALASQKLASQLSFGWNNYTWARLQGETGRRAAYLYYFTRVPPGAPDYGAFHSAELGYALHTLHKWRRPFTGTDRTLEKAMSSYWVNFAKTGDPNGAGLPAWKAFDGTAPSVMELGDAVKATALPFQGQLRLLDELNR